jgi:hypothetical protein
MTPQDRMNVTGAMTPVRGSLAAAKAASTVGLLAGIWFFVSPWVYGSYTHGVAFNNWFAAALIIIFSLSRLARPAYATAMCWANMVMAIWVFCSPWIYAYAGTNSARFINSIVVGIVLFIAAVISLRVSAPRIPSTGTSATPTGTPLPRT